MTKRIGVFGGSFNPPHLGHLAVAEESYTQLNLDEVWLLVSPQNPLKDKQGMADYTLRVELCEILAEKYDWLKVSTYEADNNLQYTAQTLKKLTSDRPDCQFIWVMGSENLTHLHNWEDWEDIFNTVPIACVFRDEGELSVNMDSPAAQKFKKHLKNKADSTDSLPNWRILHMEPHQGRATHIRAQLEMNETPTDLTKEQLRRLLMEKEPFGTCKHC